VIAGLRFIEREVHEHDAANNWTTVRKVRILQQHLEQHGWVDVPLVTDKPKDYLLPTGNFLHIPLVG